MPAQLKMEIDNGRWTVLTSISDGMKSRGGANLELLGDGSILASGKNPEWDTYLITTNVPLRHIRAIRLEVIPDASLPHRAQGRCSDGWFGLNEFRVLIIGEPRSLDTVVVTTPEVRDYQPLVKLKYFVGLTIPETSEAMGILTATAERYWKIARAWLHSQLTCTE